MFETCFMLLYSQLQNALLFHEMISSFNQPSMKSSSCQYRLPSYSNRETLRLNLRFCNTRNESVTLLYGLITEINLEVDSETSMLGGERSMGKTLTSESSRFQIIFRA